VVSDRQTLAEFDAAFPRFVAVAHRATRKFFRYDDSKIEDAVAETMARTYAHWESVRRHETPHGWVVVCAKNVCLERLRADARHARPAEGAERAAVTATIWQGLRQLSRRQRNVAVLRYLMDFDEVATARALGTSVEQVETVAHEASGPLQPLLAEVYAGPAPIAR
jgi:RNA polymerase sigma factor (sigma-70 family)